MARMARDSEQEERKFQVMNGPCCTADLDKTAVLVRLRCCD